MKRKWLAAGEEKTVEGKQLFIFSLIREEAG